MLNNFLAVLFLFLFSTCAYKVPANCKGLSCYEKGQKYMAKREWAKAFPIMKLGCESLNSFSCTNASAIASNLNMDPAIKLQYSLMGCQLGDEMGCYNFACYSCEMNQKEITLKYLDKSFKLGGRNWKARLNDPDFVCLSPEQKLIIKKYAESDKYNFPANPFRHVYAPSLLSWVILPPNYDVQSTSPVALKNLVGARLVHSFTQYNSKKEILKMIATGEGKLSVSSEETRQKNGFAQWLVKGSVIAAENLIKQEFVLSALFTPKGTMLTWGRYSPNKVLNFSGEVHDFVESTVYNPFVAPSEAAMKLADGLQMKFAGLHNGRLVYTKDGKYSDEAKPLLAFNLDFYTLPVIEAGLLNVLTSEEKARFDQDKRYLFLPNKPDVKAFNLQGVVRNHKGNYQGFYYENRINDLDRVKEYLSQLEIGDLLKYQE